MALAAAVASVAGDAGAELRPGVPLDGSRLDLRELAGGAVSVGGGAESVARRFPFSFPTDAEQSWEPPGSTYVMHLDATVVLAPGSPSGQALVSGVVNDCAGVQAIVRVLARNGFAKGRWNSFSALEGDRHGIFKDGRARISVSNYLPSCAVKSGPTELELKVEPLYGIELERVEFEPGTGLEVTDRAPPQIELRPVYPDEWARVREPFRVGFEVENVGEVPARNVSVSLASEDERLLVKGRSDFRYVTLEDTEEGEFRLFPSRRGEYQLVMRVSAENANKPLVRIGVPVNPPEAVEDSSLPPWVLAGAVAAVLAAAVVIVRRRRSPANRHAP